MQRRRRETAEENEGGRKRAEEALRASEEKFRGLFETMTQGVVYQNADGKIVSANPAAERILGLTLDQMQGRTSTDPRWRAVHEDGSDYPGETHPAMVALRTGKEVHSAVMGVFNPKSEQHRWISINAVPQFKPGEAKPFQVYTTFTDITERKRSEATLRVSEEKYRGLFEGAMDGIALADADTGILVDCNQALAAMVGRNRAELIGQPQTILHPPARDKSTFSPTFKLHATTHEGQVLETQVITATSGIREVEIKASLLHLQGRKMLQGIFRDITERKRAEEELRRRVEELAALQATVLDITGPHDLPTLLKTVVERAARLVGASSGGMYLCDPGKQEARCVVSYNTPHDYTGATLKYGEGAAGIVAQTGEPLIVDDYRTWQGRAGAFEEERPFGALLTVPMIWQGRVTGVIHILDDTASRRFTQADQKLLTLFADHAAIAVENARMLEQEKRHAEELARYSTGLEQLVFERTGKLAESERRFRELADLLPQIVFEIDGNGNVQYMNRAGFAATGLSEEEFSKGLNAFRVLAPAERDRATRGIERVMTGEMIGQREFTVLRKDGTAFPVLVYTAPIVREGKSAGLRGIAIDITERKRAEEEIRAAKKRLDYVITSNPAVIITGRPHSDLTDFDITYMSSNLISMLGYEPEQFIKDPEFWARHVHPDDRKRALSQLPHLFKEGHVGYDYRFLHKDGKYRWVHEEVRAIRHSTGKPVEVIGYWTDITQQKQMEQELARAQRFATVGETAAMVGHDLRNPLTGMMAATHYLRTKDGSRLSEKGKEMLQLIDEDILRSDKITNDLLEFSGDIHLELSQINAKSITEDALGRMRIPKGIRVVNSTKKRPTIELDVGKMRRVFLNIIRNALEAMPEGGTLTITSARSGDNAHITFRDTGEGMTIESLRKLWSPLFTTKAKGMGLGLPISKRFVEAHGGTITVKTKPGKGSAFTVTLPVRQAEVKPKK